MQEFSFSSQDIFSHPEILLQKGIAQIELTDTEFFSDRAKLLKFVGSILAVKWGEKGIPFFSFNLKIDAIDRETVNALSEIPCSLQFDYVAEYAVQKKKFFNKKISLLNESGMVFGLSIDSSEFSAIKSFKSCIDEVCRLYPNHIWIDNENLKPTEKLSTQDIKKIRQLTTSIETFYTYGRAVPWFLAVLEPLRIKPSFFFSDFAEWQECNNCGLNSSFDCEKARHSELERMQLAFLLLKYEEKRNGYLMSAVSDLVRLHGAFSRAESEGEETRLQLNYSPDDILSPGAMDLVSFTEETCLEPVCVSVIPGEFEAEIIYGKGV